MRARRTAIIIVSLTLGLGGIASARVTNKFPALLPSATITSDDSGSARNSDPEPIDSAPPSPVPASPPGHHSQRRHHASVPVSSPSVSVEATHAIVKLKKDAWAYSRPTSSSPNVERVHSGKFINVTGSTRNYVQVKLKQGKIGYIPASVVDLTRPEDKVMRLSSNAAVVSEPNRYGRKVSEVHQGHDVHVIGVALNYMKIRMKNGLEGYIPMTAAE